MTFPGLLIVYPLKPPGTPWGGVGQFCVGEYKSHINQHMRANFGCGQTVVSKKGGGVRETGASPPIFVNCL